MANKEPMQSIDLTPLMTPVAVLLSGIMVSASLFFGLRGLDIDVKSKVDDVALSSSSSSASSTGSVAGTDTTTPTVVTKDKLKDLFNGDYIKFGDANRKVLLVEVSDPSCPYCHAASGKNPELNKQIGTQFVLTSDGGTYLAPVPEFKKLVDEGKASYLWVYSNGHGNGEMGTQALYCANEKGKFWEAHDLLYSNAGYNMLNNTVKNDKGKSADLADFLASAVDKGFMKSCLESGKYASRITSDQQIGTSFQIQGTPSFYVNDQYYPGAYSYNDMKSSVESQL